jgi:hypothetical protein
MRGAHRRHILKTDFSDGLAARFPRVGHIDRHIETAQRALSQKTFLSRSSRPITGKRRYALRPASDFTVSEIKMPKTRADIGFRDTHETALQ